jgi:hypothetical protein
MNGPGRWRRQVRRAFLGNPSKIWGTGELLRKIKPRGPFDVQEYARVRRAAALFADSVGYARRGRFSRAPGGILWRAKHPLPPMPKYPHTGGDFKLC